MATTQTKLVGFCLGDKTNYNATTYANHIWFDPNNKQILLNGIEYIPKKLSELVNDKNFLTSITKAMVEGVLTGNITSHTHPYLPLTGGTLSGALTCNGDYINMNNDSGSRGYRGFFNQSNSTSRASGSHIFMYGGGEALGTNSVSIGYQAYAGIRNKDSDATTYPYIAWQWMPTEKFMVDTTNSATLSGGEYYGFPLLPNEMVQWDIGGQKVIYENSSSHKELLVVIKASDADTGLVFGGKTTLPYSASKTLIAGKYIVGSGEYLKNITEITINNVKYYQVIIYTWDTTAFPTYYDFTQQVKVMCATKVSNSNYNGASSYASGYSSVASGSSSVAIGSSSVASGYSSVASGNYSVASGYSSVASGNYSVASGYSSVARGAYSVASGYYSVASGAYSVASGHSSVASGYYSVASGSYSVASGYYSVASGASSVASGDSSVASGNCSVASGDSSVASGYSSVASGNYSVAIGNYSVASGYYSVASHNHCTVLARNGETMSIYQTIVGKFNAKVAGLFIIGNGTSDTARSNAFVVDDSGNVTAKYFSGYANAIGGEGIKVYATNSNEINFGGTSSSTTICFGYRSMDSRPTPTIYNFGNGTATIQAASFTGNASTSTKSEYSRNLLGRNTSGSDYPAISGNLVFAEWNTMSDNRWYLKANGYECRVAYATSATKLGASSVGSATQPIYLNGGTPTACSHTLGKSVPSNAVFTDTTYSVATASADGLMSAAMFKAQMVKSVGVKQGEAMIRPDGTITITDRSVYVTQDKSNITGVYQTASGENDVKIPNATKDYDGSMSYTDKRKLDDVHNNCVAASVYVLNLSYDFTNLNGLTLKMTNFLGLSAAIASGHRPDMIRLVTNFTTHIFTLYDSTNAINDGSFFYYRCDGKNAEISIENDEISFSVN